MSPVVPEQITKPRFPESSLRAATAARAVLPAARAALPVARAAVSSVRAVTAAWAAVLTGLLLWPQFRGGYGLGHDMVFTPRQPLSWASLGLGSSSPRAVPVDAVVSLLSKIVGGEVVGRIALAFPLLAAGIGAAWLLEQTSGVGPASRVPAGRRLVGGLAATGLAIWNPYVIERLAVGQWALLWAYAALPWLVGYAARMRRGESGLRGLLIWTAAASITPTGGLIALVTGAVIALPERGRQDGDRPERGRRDGDRPERGRRDGASPERGRRDGASPERDGSWRRWWLAIGGAVALQLPWLVASLVGTASATSDPAGVAAFAARSEHAGGPLLSLAGMGGIWDADVVPASRAGGIAVAGLVVVLVAVVAGWTRLRDTLGRVTARRLSWCALAGFVLAAAASVPGASAVMRALVRTVPGAGLLRDAQKWLMPYVLLIVLLAGAAVARVAVLAAWRVAVAALALAGPIVLVPDATRTVHAVLAPVHYPADWSWAAADVGHGGDVAVLPFQSYRDFAWAPGRSVLDPAPRLLPGDVVVSDRLAVSGRVLTGEDGRARTVAAALDAGAQLPQRLAAAGVGWVLVERGTPGPVPDLTGLTLVRSGPNLTLYRVPGPVIDAGPGAGRIVAVLTGDGLALLVVAVACLPWTRRRVRYRPVT